MFPPGAASLRMDDFSGAVAMYCGVCATFAITPIFMWRVTLPFISLWRLSLPADRFEEFLYYRAFAAVRSLLVFARSFSSNPCRLLAAE